MSGPIVPPLEVTEVDGNPSGRPITKIIVSNGDLSISGREATIDTSGSGGAPATPADAIQFNSDPAGTFTADDFFKMSVIGGDATTAIQVGNMILGGNKVAANTANQSVSVICDGTGEIFLQSESDGGGTFTDSVVNIMCNTNTDESQLKFRDGTNVNNGTITLDGSGHMVLNNNVAAKNISLKVGGSGTVIAENITTDTDSQLSILADGTGTPILKLENGSSAIEVICEANKKLTINGGAGQTFIFDASSATGGITWPDGTEQITAATGGVSFPLEAPDGSVSAPSYSFSSETNTGLYRYGLNEMGVAVNGSLPITISSSSVWFQSGNRLRADAGSAAAPSLSFYGDGDTGIFSSDSNEIGFSTFGTEVLTIGMTSLVLGSGINVKVDAGSVSSPGINFTTDANTGLYSAGSDALGLAAGGVEGITISETGGTATVQISDAYTLPTADGDADQVLTTDGAGAVTFADAGGGGGFNVSLPYGGDIDAAMYTMTACQPGWGGSNMSTVTAPGYAWFYPFVSAKTGDLASITVNVTTAEAASTIDVGIYSDVDGVPGVLIGKANIDTSATGHITQTSLSATIATVRSTQYWVGWTKVAGSTIVIRGVNDGSTYNAPASLGVGTSLNYTDRISFYVEQTSLPASITSTDLFVSNDNAPNVGLLW